MKKIMLFLAVLATPFLYAQNNFPTNGQVTIGTATASAGTALDVNGRVVIDSSLTVKDSLVVEQRIRAKDKLIVDGKAVFKDDAVVRLNLKVDGNARVDGVARLNGNVRMLNIGNINNLNNAPFEFLVRKDNGQVKRVSSLAIAQYLGALGNPFGCIGDGNGDILNPMWGNGINKLFVECSQVNVGIGTTNPNHKLTVIGTNYAIRFLAGATNSPQNALYNGYEASNLKDLMHLGREINSGAGNQTYEERFTVANSGATEITTIGSDAAFTINNGSGHAIVVYDSQNHKILQLEDNGLFRTRRIKVDEDSWADYVFNKDYELMSLSKTEEFILAKGHLPKMPSAEEIENEGLDLGNMQKLQMEKIEELFLHVIELEKKVESLYEENLELKKQILSDK